MKITILHAVVLVLCHVNCTAQTIDKVLDLWGAHGGNSGVSIKPNGARGHLIFANVAAGGDSVGGFPYVVHLNAQDSVDWQQIYLPDSTESYLQFSGWDGVDHALDLGYVAAGISSLPEVGDYRGCVMRIDEAGVELWRRYVTFGSNSTYFNNARFTPDGGCLAAGLYFTGGAVHSVVVRLDTSGNVLWNRAIAPPGGGIAEGLMALPDGGFMLCGMQGYGNAYTPWYGRFDPNGDLVWDQALPPAEHPRRFIQIKAYSPNAYALLGVEKAGVQGRPLFAMIDSSGVLDWLTPVGRFDEWEGFLSLECVPGKGIVGYGHGWDPCLGEFCPSQQGYLVALSAEGDSLSALKVSHVFDTDSLAYAGRFEGLSLDTNGRMLAVGRTNSWPWQGWDSRDDIWIYGLGAEDCMFPDCGPPQITTPVTVEEVATGRMGCSPNPVSPGGTLTLTLPAATDHGDTRDVSLLIYGADGRRAAEVPVETSLAGVITVSIGNLRPGAYTLMFNNRKAYPYVSRIVVM